MEEEAHPILTSIKNISETSNQIHTLAQESNFQIESINLLVLKKKLMSIIKSGRECLEHIAPLTQPPQIETRSRFQPRIIARTEDSISENNPENSDSVFSYESSIAVSERDLLKMEIKDLEWTLKRAIDELEMTENQNRHLVKNLERFSLIGCSLDLFYQDRFDDRKDRISGIVQVTEKKSKFERRFSLNLEDMEMREVAREVEKFSMKRNQILRVKTSQISKLDRGVLG